MKLRVKAALMTFVIGMVALASYQTGHAVDHAQVEADVAAHEHEPLSAIAIEMCGKLAGFMIVQRSGKVTGIPHTATEEQLEALADSLPNANTMLATMPCVHPAPTT